MGKKGGSNVLPYSKNGNLGSRIFEYHDKMLLKKDYAEKRVRVVGHLQDMDRLFHGAI
jgi:hypothetical protein